MKTKVQIHFLKMLSILAVTSLLVAILNMYATQHVSAADPVRTITHPGFLPNALALDETRNRLFVFDRSTLSIFIYNAATLEEIGSVTTTLEDSMSMVVDESAGKLYVGYFGPGVEEITDGIAVIDIAAAALIKYLPSGGYTYLVKDEDLDVVYASSNLGVSKINVISDIQTPITGINGNLYTSMAVNPVTHELFVANWSQNDGNLFIVDPTTLDITAIPNMNGFGVTVNWVENKVYVTFCASGVDDKFCVLDRDTGAVSLLSTQNDSTEALAFNPLVNRLYSDAEINAIATIVDGATDAFTNVSMTSALSTVGVRYSTDNVYYINASGTYVMKGSTGEIVAGFPVGASCSVCDGDIVINQTSGLVYVINDDSAGMVMVIQDGTFTRSCTVTPLAGAGIVAGALTSSDCHSPLRNELSYWDPYFADRYSINVKAGQQVSIVLDGGEAYEYVYLLDPSGNILMEASGSYSGPARIPSSGFFTALVSGTYVIEVTSVWSGLENGSFFDSEWPYTLTLAIAESNQTLIVNKSGTGSGTVSSSPAGINCGSDCSESFAYNTVVTLTAAPTSPSTFGGWSGAGCSGTGTCIVTMSSARSVTANFIDATPPIVTAITRVNPSPTSLASVKFTVKFSEVVTGVDAADFSLTLTGVTGAKVTAVSGTGATRTVTVSTGSGNGTLRLNVVDNDTIRDAAGNKLGGTGAGNGNYTAGQTYTIVDKTAPKVISSVRANPNPTNLARVRFTVKFSEVVTGVDAADFSLTLTGIKGAKVIAVSGSGATRTVTVSTGTGNGTLRLNIIDNDTILDKARNKLGGTGLRNGNYTAGQTYTIRKP
jgi:hypothetical protein